jgi:hypothetical protein
MSRTALCVLTAAGLATVALALMLGRYLVLGDQVKRPSGPNSWRVSLQVTGQSTGEARVMTATPLDFARQHVYQESFKSAQLLNKPIDARYPQRRQVIWSQRAGVPAGAFQVHYEFCCQTSVSRPTAPMAELTRTLYARPEPGEHLEAEPGIECHHADLAELARRLTADFSRPLDQVEALFRFVDREIANEPTISGPAVGALECLTNESGDSGAKSRLLVALCRNRGVPARLVTGLVLAGGDGQSAHSWVEAWVRDQWLPMCPVFHHFGRLPRTYLVFGFDDLVLVRARNVRDLGHSFTIQRLSPETAEPAELAGLAWLFNMLSFHSLPPPEQRLVEFLLLLPIAALIVCIFRNLIGIGSFGTFAPALLGLAFRDVGSLPGFVVIVVVVLLGWGMRRLLDRYHLLQVPRSAFLLSLVVAMLVACVLLANHAHLPTTRYISLVPLVILTGMIERFWTLEAEDGAGVSFRTLLATLLIAASIGLFLSLHAVARHMFRYPETLGLVMAAQLLIGRYTGYRLLELYRFRDFLDQDHKPEVPFRIAG